MWGLKKLLSPKHPGKLKWHADSISNNRDRQIQDGLQACDPVMLRAYHEGNKGATAFFRNRPLMDTVMKALLERCGNNDIRVLFHASSIGAEPYSLALWWQHRYCQEGKTLKIFATDIDGAFLDISKRAVYPVEVTSGMTLEEQSWFDCLEKNISIPEASRQLVEFLPPMNFVTQQLDDVFDAVFLMNALTYVTPEEQARAISNISACSRHVIAVTAFHPDTIRSDIESVGFEPYKERMEDIHDAWGDRLTENYIDPQTSDYSWRIPLFNRDTPDYDYRYCSLFVRKSE